MPQLIIEVIGDASNLDRTFRRVMRQTETFGQKMGRFARVGAFTGLTAGVVGLTAALKVGFDEMAEGEKAAAQTNAALKSTGRVAGVTAGQIEQLAGSIQRYSGADDEAIQGAENLLLTFTKIRNQVGQGNDIFDQTTKAIVDLSTRFDQDLSTSAVQLGKALNDPARGLTALRRIGISFSDSQVRLINRLSESGRTLEAQKLILREVNREVGGSARAFGQTLPGQIQILRGNLENLAGDLLETLNPEIKKLTDRFNKWLENPENKKRVINDFTTAIELLGDAFHKGAKFVGEWNDAWHDFGGTLQDVIDKLNGGDFKRALQVLQAQQRVQQGLANRGPRGPQGPVGNLFGLVGPVGAAGGPTIRSTAGAGPFGFTGSGTAGMKERELAKLREEAAVRSNTWFDNMIDRLLGRAGDPRSLKGQIGRLNTIAGLLQKRIAATKDITRRLRLQDELDDVLIMIRDRQDERRQKAVDARKEAAAAARDRQLGWLDFALERAEDTKGDADNRRALRAKEKFYKDLIRTEGRTLEWTRELWRTRKAIRDLNKQNADVDPLAGLMQVSSKRMANLLGAGLGLSPAGMGRLQANIAGQEIHNYVYLDGHQVASSVNRQNARTGHRTARQTSGFRG